MRASVLALAVAPTLVLSQSPLYGQCKSCLVEILRMKQFTNVVF